MIVSHGTSVVFSVFMSSSDILEDLMAGTITLSVNAFSVNTAKGEE